MTRTDESRTLLERDPLGHSTPVVILAAASILVCALVRSALDAFVASDDDVWFAWCSQPIVNVIGPGAPSPTTRPAFALLMAIETRLFGQFFVGDRR